MAENATPKKKRLSEEWRPIFLATLRNTANVRAAYEAAGITRRTAYRNRQSSAEFRQAWDEAIEDACDVLEATAFQRARKSSDTLLIFLLKAHRPQKYRETMSVNVNLQYIREKAQEVAERLGVPVGDVLAHAERVAIEAGAKEL